MFITAQENKPAIQHHVLSANILPANSDVMFDATPPCRYIIDTRRKAENDHTHTGDEGKDTKQGAKARTNASVP